MTPISVCCLTFNSERTVRKTMESVKEVADEIVVVDSFSTDGTLDIVREFTDRVYQREYTYHGLQMNYAIDQCSHDWVFCIDSDEYMNEEMKSTIKNLKRDGLTANEAFRHYREWYFLGKPIHAMYPISSPDKIVRFFNRTIARFNDRPVHDKPEGFQFNTWMEGRLIHDTIASLHDLFDKLNKYTTRHAKGFASEADKVRVTNLVLNPIGAFFKWYVLKKNILDGYRGFILGVYAAAYTFFKYAKLYEIKKNREGADAD